MHWGGGCHETSHELRAELRLQCTAGRPKNQIAQSPSTSGAIQSVSTANVTTAVLQSYRQSVQEGYVVGVVSMRPSRWCYERLCGVDYVVLTDTCPTVRFRTGTPTGLVFESRLSLRKDFSFRARKVCRTTISSFMNPS